MSIDFDAAKRIDNHESESDNFMDSHRANLYCHTDVFSHGYVRVGSASAGDEIFCIPESSDPLVLTDFIVYNASKDTAHRIHKSAKKVEGLTSARRTWNKITCADIVLSPMLSALLVLGGIPLGIGGLFQLDSVAWIVLGGLGLLASALPLVSYICGFWGWGTSFDFTEVILGRKIATETKRFNKLVDSVGKDGVRAYRVKSSLINFANSLPKGESEEFFRAIFDACDKDSKQARRYVYSTVTHYRKVHESAVKEKARLREESQAATDEGWKIINDTREMFPKPF